MQKAHGDRGPDEVEPFRRAAVKHCFIVFERALYAVLAVIGGLSVLLEEFLQEGAVIQAGR